MQESRQGDFLLHTECYGGKKRNLLEVLCITAKKRITAFKRGGNDECVTYAKVAFKSRDLHDGNGTACHNAVPDWRIFSR